MSLLVGFMIAAIVLDHAHLACPIALGWGSPSFRQHMLERPDRYILLPALCLIIPIAVGAGSLSTQDPAFRAIAGVYFLANAWHFASQNYGICALSGGSQNQRNAAFVLTAVCILALPILWKHALWVVLADLGISVIHWVTDIRLSAFMASGYWPFLLIMLMLGTTGFLFKTWETDPQKCGLLLACTTAWSFPILLSLRYGLGFWHFLMSRWVWSATGRELLV